MSNVRSMKRHNLRLSVFLHTLLAVLSLLWLLPVAWLLSLTGNLDAVWYSFFIAEVCALVLATLFFRRTYKNKIQRLETIEFK